MFEIQFKIRKICFKSLNLKYLNKQDIKCESLTPDSFQYSLVLLHTIKVLRSDTECFIFFFFCWAPQSRPVRPHSCTVSSWETLHQLGTQWLAKGHFREDRVPDFHNKSGDLSTEVLQWPAHFSNLLTCREAPYNLCAVGAEAALQAEVDNPEPERRSPDSATRVGQSGSIGELPRLILHPVPSSSTLLLL